jgi:plastocyanin
MTIMQRIMRFLAIAGAAVALVLLPSAAVAQDAGSAFVSVQDNQFSPATLKVSPGDSVTWSFEGSSAHTVTADDGSFDSGTLNQGDSFGMTFDTPGTYAYYCNIHGGPGGIGMAGTIVVAS